MSSVISSRINRESPTPLVEEEYCSSSVKNHNGKGKEIGQSSHSSQTLCMIRMDGKVTSEMFTNNSCTHLFCADCISQYVATKLQENISSVKFHDPNCRGLLEPQCCRDIIPQELFDRWGDALCESMILGSQKCYCPYKDCSAMV
ncbi:hypothetical protein SO802_004814 [Lithocarpus litseifolius]|uniref:RING-type domain-containing protein n=1 Tax=Lithocarpus litseifolius TaxID=425828 RepID=A0AAW2DKZ0_9ROSI